MIQASTTLRPLNLIMTDADHEVRCLHKFSNAMVSMISSKTSVKMAPQGSIVITLDGPAGAGKSTISKKLAHELGFLVLDSGAIYRAMALALLEEGVSIDSVGIPKETLDKIRIRVEPCETLMRIFLDDVELKDEIREEYVGAAASRFAALPEVRASLLAIQRDVARSWNIVAEGRDMGNVVFPNAFIKLFITADIGERARRRFTELLMRGDKPYYSDVLSQMRARDSRDESRKTAPLVAATDSTIIDTTHLTPESALKIMLQLIEDKYDFDHHQTNS